MKQLVFILFFFISINLYAQDYFQQDVHYKIEVELNDVDHSLSGKLDLTYTNNSNDALEFIYFHIWPNAYKNANTALGKQLLRDGDLQLYYGEDEIKGGIDSLEFFSNENKLSWEYHPEHIDICKVMLPSPLNPGESISISTPFKVKLPSGSISRLGHIGQSYQITQWYPKPAVYDRNGWNEMPYLNQGEFYSEFGTYDVYITLPDNYVVGATGDLQGERGQQELEWLDLKAQETQLEIDSKALPLLNKDGRPDMTFPESSNTKKTLHYHQENVHDFGWFADKRYHVLKGEVELPHSKEKVTTWAMFTNKEAKIWSNSIEYLNDAIYYYSLWNGDYPYRHCTAVDGTISAGGGMEYPNVTVIGASGNAFGLETVIMHEVGHNWFYGILGTNERIHPWMDEGINSANELRYVQTKYPNEKLLGGMLPIDIGFLHLDDFKHAHQYALTYLVNGSRNGDQPIELPADDYTSMNYGGIVYSKSAVAFNYLRGYLGDEIYDECMHTYFDRWKFKHPQPKDLQNIFEEVSGKDLRWFFKDMINSTGTIDVKITKYKAALIKADKSKMYFKVEQKGSIAAPFSASVIKGDSVLHTEWFEPNDTEHYWYSLPKTDEFDRIEINRLTPQLETSADNNQIKQKGLIKKMEPLRMQFLSGIKDPSYTNLYWLPMLAYNKYDALSVGALFHNYALERKSIEFYAAPMYSIGQGRITGMGNLQVNISNRSRKIVNNIWIGSDIKSFTYYNSDKTNNLTLEGYNSDYNFLKIAPYVTFELSKKKFNSVFNHHFSIKSHMITKNMLQEFSTSDTLISNDTQEQDMYLTGTYYRNSRHAVFPNTIKVEGEYNEEFAKVSLDYTQKWVFDEWGKNVKLRVFVGKFLFNDSNNPVYNYRMDGTSGYYDYKFNYAYLGRYENNKLLSQQFVDDQGGFKIATGYEQSNDMIVAFNLESDLPYIPFLKVFADYGFNSGYTSNNNKFVYDAGVSVSLANDILSIYCPLIYSDNIKNELEINDVSFKETIRFTLKLHNINPFKLLRELPY